MIRYALSKLGQALFVVTGAYIVTFIGIHLLPSDPIMNYMIANEMALDAETIAKMKHYYGFDRPLYEQFFVQLGGILQGNLGYSLKSARPVTQEIGEVVFSTLQLAGAAALIALAITFAIVAAADLTRSNRLRAVIEGIPPLLGAMPSFWLGMVLLQLLSFKLRILSVFPDGSWLSLLVPAFVLGLYVAAPLSQVMLKSVETARALPFVDAVRAKGGTRGWIFLRHLLKYTAGNGATVLGLAVGGLLAGSVVTETVFSRPGIGRVLQDAVSNQDIALVQGFVILIAGLYVTVNLVVDLLYPLLDPRIVVQTQGSSPRIA
jgi:peptide/nickel transport system permease protein